MLRRLLVDAMSVSLLLCIGTGMFAIRNRSSVELLALGRGTWPANSHIYSAAGISLGFGEGRVCIGYGRWGFDFSRAAEIDAELSGPRNPLQYRLRCPSKFSFVHQQHALSEPYTLLPDWHGFAWSDRSNRSAAQWENSLGLTVPAWLMMLLTGLLPLAFGVAEGRRLLSGSGRAFSIAFRHFRVPARGTRTRAAGAVVA